MRNGYLFWGSALLTTGLLFLINQFNFYSFDLYFLIDAWPLFLILVGLVIITKDSFLKPVIVTASGIFSAFYFFAVVTFMTSGLDFDSCDDDINYSSHSYFDVFDEKTEYAELNISSGITKIEVNNLTKYLIYAENKGFLDSYNFRTRKTKNSTQIFFDMDNSELSFDGSNVNNLLNISLNENPIWTLNFSVGATRNILNLKDFKIEEINLESGASKFDITIGDKFERCVINVDMGISSVKIKIPKESGCKISGDMAFGVNRIKGFKKSETDYYITENFEEARNKIYINYNSGFSSFAVQRY